MKNKLHCRFLTLALIAISFCSGFIANARHIAGARLSYSHISGDTYLINLELLGDCYAPADILGQLSTSTPYVGIYNDTSYVNSLALNIDTSKSNIEVTPNCTLEPTACTSTSSAIPGLRKFVYTGQFTFPFPLKRWRIVFDGNLGMGFQAARSYNLTNINLSGGPTDIEAILNNTTSFNSNTVIKNDLPIYFCLNKNESYNPSIIDIDGDSISISLVPGRDGYTGSPVTYLSPFTFSNPIAASPGSFVCSPANGIINFVPNQVQDALVVYRIKEYRGTTLIGSSESEMNFRVLTCIDNGCTLLGVGAEPAARKLHCYPNPASDEITVTLPYFSDRADISIADVLGRTVFQKIICDNKLTSCTLDVSHLLQGTYCMRVNVDGAMQTESVTIW